MVYNANMVKKKTPAVPIFKLKYEVRDKDGNLVGIMEIRIYRVKADGNFPEGVKYALQFAKYLGRGEFDKDFLRYDNEKRKGPHKHIKGKEFPYKFVSVDRLFEDFKKDFERLTGLPFPES